MGGKSVLADFPLFLSTFTTFLFFSFAQLSKKNAPLRLYLIKAHFETIVL